MEEKHHDKLPMSNVRNNLWKSSSNWMRWLHDGPCLWCHSLPQLWLWVPRRTWRSLIFHLCSLNWGEIFLLEGWFASFEYFLFSFLQRLKGVEVLVFAAAKFTGCYYSLFSVFSAYLSINYTHYKFKEYRKSGNCALSWTTFIGLRNYTFIWIDHYSTCPNECTFPSH